MYGFEKMIPIFLEKIVLTLQSNLESLRCTAEYKSSHFRTDTIGPAVVPGRF